MNHGDRAGKRSRPVDKQQKHLYLVLDDWTRGFTIRKINIDAMDSDPDLDLEPAPVYPVNFFFNAKAKDLSHSLIKGGDA